MAQLLQTQTQTQSQLEKKKKKLASYKEDVAELQPAVDGKASEREDALLRARTIHFQYQSRVERAKERTQEGVADSDDSMCATTEPSAEDLEAIETPSIRKTTEFYQAKIAKFEKELDKVRERNAMSTEDPEVAREKYLEAAALLRTFPI